MPTFAYTIWPAREGFAPATATPDELAAVSDHWSYLVALNAGGEVRFVGRSTSEPFIGICVYEATDETAARSVAEGDPAVIKGVFAMRCQPYAVFFLDGEAQTASD